MNSVIRHMMQNSPAQVASDNQRLQEALQRITLAGLYRGGFFSKAAFYGGTCLRLFHGLPRFSEDLDFSLLQGDPSFNLEAYFPYIVEEFEALGEEISINKKVKSQKSAIESAFLKSDTSIYDVSVDAKRAIKIKLEVDTKPPLGFTTEDRALLLPFSFMTKCYQLPSLYAGKMHAFLFRSWKTRVKGRDWFDFEWYVRNNVSLEFSHFVLRVKQLTPKEPFPHTTEELRDMLKRKIRSTSIEQVKKDVAPFIPDQSVMDIWSTEYFCQLVDLMQFIE